MASDDPILQHLRQTILAELGLHILGADNLGTLTEYAARAVADAVGVPIVGVLNWSASGSS